MRTLQGSWTTIGLLGVVAGRAMGQGALSSVASDSAIRSFLQTARAATARYQDPAVAVVDGYRAVGPDAPGMGRHWVNVKLLFAGVVDPAHPPVLEYTRLNGRSALVGVSFAVPLDPGQRPPDHPVAQSAWHMHHGALDEESMPFSHSHHGQQDAASVAVLHAWVWTENPAGVFTPDNWALPFRRLGLPVPARLEPAAAKMVSFASGGDAYYRGFVGRATVPGSAAASATDSLLQVHRAAVERFLAARARGAPLDEQEQAQLAARWAQLWREVAHLIGAEAWARLGATPP